MALRRFTLLLAASCALGAPLPASAQSEADRLARATAAYEEGTRLLDAQRYDEACPRLEEAVALVPIGVGAQLALGVCYERQGRLASSLARYREAAQLGRTSGQVERAQRAEAAAAAIAPRVGTLTVGLEQGAGANDLRVVVDGAPWPADSIGKPRPIDAGSHRVEVTAAGHHPFAGSVETRDAAAATIAVTLRIAPPSPPPTGDATTPAQGAGSSFPLRPVGLVVGGVGVAGLVLGALTGGVAMGLKADGDVGCNPEGFCPQASIDARDDAFTMATVSTIGFVAGGALVGAGVVLFVVGGEGDPVVSGVIGPRAFTVGGAF